MSMFSKPGSGPVILRFTPLPVGPLMRVTDNVRLPTPLLTPDRLESGPDVAVPPVDSTNCGFSNVSRIMSADATGVNASREQALSRHSRLRTRIPLAAEYVG